MSRTGRLETILSKLGFFPQEKPTVYTGIRNHALAAFHSFSSSPNNAKTEAISSTIIGRLWESHISQNDHGISDMELASEAADHLLAGVDTTSDTLMFLIWALSRSCNKKFQEKLIKEVKALPRSALDESGIPTVNATLNLPYLDAVIKETLRLYAPLPVSEPRSYPVDCNIDQYKISANTMSPYTLHRSQDVFPNPYTFDPTRWLVEEGGSTAEEVAERKKWFWAFSSGGRMCIGM